MKLSSKKFFNLKIGVLIILIISMNSCKLTEFFKKDKEEDKSVNKTFNIKMPVTVSPANKDNLIKYVKTNGVATAYEKADIYAEVSGTIEDISINSNDLVKKDEQIMAIDKDRLKLDVKNTELKLKKAQTEFNAWKKLGENGNDEQIKLRTGLTEYKIALEKLKLDLEKTSIKAPFNGILTDLNFNQNEKISAGSKIGSIYNLDKIRLKVDILESEITKIKKKNEVIVSFPSITGKLYYGKVNSINPYVKTANRTCEAEIIIQNDGQIKAGMYADVKIASKILKDRILIYKDALLVRDGKKLIFAAEDGKAKWQYVEIGEENEKFYEIISGAKPDQKIIIDGNFSLSHDANVKVKKEIPYEEIKKRF